MTKIDNYILNNYVVFSEMISYNSEKLIRSIK